jgi:hypothetical protein
MSTKGEVTVFGTMILSFDDETITLDYGSNSFDHAPWKEIKLRRMNELSKRYGLGFTVFKRDIGYPFFESGELSWLVETPSGNTLAFVGRTLQFDRKKIESEVMG